MKRDHTTATDAQGALRDGAPLLSTPVLSRLEALTVVVLATGIAVAGLVYWVTIPAPAPIRVDTAETVSPYHLVVNVNTDPRARLRLVPGIGEATADAIVTDREAHGPFYSLGDLMRVSGIGPRSVERWQRYLTVGEVEPAAAQTQPGAEDSITVATPTTPGLATEPMLPVDVNVATVEDLQAVPGLGRVLAGRIIAFRSAYGLFHSLEELALVHGISEHTVERWREHLTLSLPEGADESE